jgi:hypothetical protein
MTEQEFEDALDRWGADLSHWPIALTGKARRHLQAQPLARRALDAAAVVDAYLDDLEQSTAPSYLERRILSQLGNPPTPAPADPRSTLLEWLTRRVWRPALVATVPVLAGFLLGFGSVAPTGGDPADGDLAVDMAMLAFSDLYSELDHAQP